MATRAAEFFQVRYADAQAHAPPKKIQRLARARSHTANSAIIGSTSGRGAGPEPCREPFGAVVEARDRTCGLNVRNVGNERIEPGGPLPVDGATARASEALAARP